ncbi:MAG: AAA family ATPase [Opitutales bacterium]|nr:AAA family ATPase [Opitutales bacterium]
MEKSLSDDWLCYYSVQFLSGRRGEIDFILFHKPSGGVIIIEQKNCKYIEWANGTWWARMDDESEEKDISKQLDKEVEAFAEHCNRYCACDFNYSNPRIAGVLAFPQKKYCDYAEYGYEGNVLFCDSDYDSLEEQFLELLGERDEWEMPPELMESTISSFVKKSFRFMNLSVFQREQFNSYINKQEKILSELLRTGKSFSVTGGAGTGKTLFAERFATIGAYAMNRRTLLLCWNKILHGIHREHTCKERDDQLCSERIETLCREITGINDEPKKDDRDFWSNLWRRALEVLKSKKQREYDLIIIDEAQLLNPEIWDIVEELRRVNSGAQWIVFYDENQRFNVKDVNGASARLYKFIEGMEAHTLTMNCRNTEATARFARLFIDDGSEFLPIENPEEAGEVFNKNEEDRKYRGQKPVVYITGPEGDKLSGVMKEFVKRFKRNGGKFDRTAFLVNRTQWRNRLKDFFPDRKSNWPDELSQIGQDEETWDFFHLSKFVGCEADTVIVFLPRDSDWLNDTKTWLYEASSRAVGRLYLFLSYENFKKIFYLDPRNKEILKKYTQRQIESLPAIDFPEFYMIDISDNVDM